MSLISSAAGNKRRRVDDSDADSDEDDEGFYKIINWVYGESHQDIVKALPPHTMKCQFPIMFSSHLQSNLSDPSFFFEVSLHYLDMEDVKVFDVQNVRQEKDWNTSKYATERVQTFSYLYDTKTMRTLQKEDKDKHGRGPVMLKCKPYLEECNKKTKALTDFYSTPSHFPGMPKFAILVVKRCTQHLNEFGAQRKVEYGALQLLVPLRLAISPGSSVYAQKRWCVKTMQKLKTGLKDFGIDSRDFVQGETYRDDGHLEMRF